MNEAAWIALIVGCIGVLLNIVGIAVAYGILQGTVKAIDSRVKALEAEIGTLNELKVTVAEVKTSLAFLVEQFKDLNASIRWMREPAAAKRQPRGTQP
jgi:hypothetical protein